MLTDKQLYALSKGYTDRTVVGGGAIKGKNCTIDSKEAITGGTRLNFKWTLDDGTELTDSIDVMNGINGKDGTKGDKGDPGTDGAPGAPGKDGKDGVDGKDGRGIKSMSITAENHLIITYDDDTTEDAGEIISSGGGGTTNYNSLTNKPQINGTTLEGNKTSSDLDIVTPSVQSEVLTF